MILYGFHEKFTLFGKGFRTTTFQQGMMIIAKYLLILLILIAVSSLTLTVYAQEGNNTVAEEPKFFAIQHAQSGTISKINDTTYTLDLNDVSDKTILFSDKPNRIVTPISTGNFIGNWSTGKDSFAVDTPNAVLVVHDLEGQDTAIIELLNPVYDIEKKTLRYDATPDNATSIELPHDLRHSTLIIDSSHAEGEGTTDSGTNSHAEGEGTTDSGTNSHAEGG